jgi:hypothetical protein
VQQGRVVSESTGSESGWAGLLQQLGRTYSNRWGGPDAAVAGAGLVQQQLGRLEAVASRDELKKVLKTGPMGEAPVDAAEVERCAKGGGGSSGQGNTGE